MQKPIPWLWSRKNRAESVAITSIQTYWPTKREGNLLGAQTCSKDNRTRYVDAFGH